MTKFLFVVVSKNQEFKISQDSIKNISDDFFIDLREISDNVESLASVYNRILQEVRQSKSYDFVGFLHADVSLDIKSLCSHLIECRSKYDVFGLCGTSILNVSQSPLNWWTGSNPTPQAKWGCVTHGELGNKVSFFSGGNRAEIRDHEVACIDGLCIVLGKNAIDSQMAFDEKFMFDCYDTDISFQTIMTYKLRLGVIVEKSLQHYSVGRSILTQEFLKHELDLRKKWNLDIPKGSALEKMAANS